MEQNKQTSKQCWFAIARYL